MNNETPETAGERPAFDPEQVTLQFHGCCSYEDYWRPGEPFPSGWGPESDARRNSSVSTEDYDELLTLYRGLAASPVALEVTNWKSLSVTAIAAENPSVAEYVKQLEETAKEWEASWENATAYNRESRAVRDGLVRERDGLRSQVSGLEAENLSLVARLAAVRDKDAHFVQFYDSPAKAIPSGEPDLPEDFGATKPQPRVEGMDITAEDMRGFSDEDIAALKAGEPVAPKSELADWLEGVIDAEANAHPESGDYVILTFRGHQLRPIVAALRSRELFWPCREGDHAGCAKSRWVECDCQCHRKAALCANTAEKSGTCATPAEDVPTAVTASAMNTMGTTLPKTSTTALPEANVAEPVAEDRREGDSDSFRRRLIADRVREPLVEDVAMMIWSFNLERRPMKQEDQVDIWPEEDEARKHTYRLIAELAVKIARKGWQSAAPELKGQHCPYDEQQCEYPKCIGTSEIYRDVRCLHIEPVPSPAQTAEDGIALIQAERLRQVSAEGWTPGHDDEHKNCEMLDAAISYAGMAGSLLLDDDGGAEAKEGLLEVWPWSRDWWKPTADPVRNLVKAGALIAAEIDRLHRAAPPVAKAAQTEETEK